MFTRRRLALLAVCGVSVMVSASGLLAEEAEPQSDPEAGSSLSFSAGFDIATAYYYRGIPQENQGVITQPRAELGVEVLKATDELPLGLGVNFGTWNSLHSNTSTNPWYESDFYTGLSVTLPRGVEVGIKYTYLYSPNAGDIFAEEIGLSLGVNEKAFFGIEKTPLDFSLSPSVELVFEVDGGSDGLGSAGQLGTFLGLNIEPTITVAEDTKYPLSLSLPMTVGLNVADYYQDSVGGDDTFGYFDIAVAGSVPLAFIPDRLGSWSLSAAVHVLVLGDSVQNIGNIDFGVSSGDTVEAYATFGITIE